MSDLHETQNYPPLVSLTKTQRRVLGTMIEKGITVPESYPLTIKALTTGCNQKNNREPVTSYSEDDVQDAIEELRKLGLAAVVHTESGRTERYRHYLRRRMDKLSEPQVAILAELLLRGRQSVGDLRARASRMAPAGTLDSLDQLKPELNGLIEFKLLQSDGSLDRRGAEVDHNLYEPREDRKLAQRASEEEPAVSQAVRPLATAAPSAPTAAPAPRPSAPAVHDPDISGRLAALEGQCTVLRNENQELRSELTDLRTELSSLGDELRKLRDALGA